MPSPSEAQRQIEEETPEPRGWYDDLDREGLERELAQAELRLERVNTDRLQARADLTKMRRAYRALRDSIEELPADQRRYLGTSAKARYRVYEREGNECVPESELLG